jgi:hypothetical protein
VLYNIDFLIFYKKYIKILLFHLEGAAAVFVVTVAGAFTSPSNAEYAKVCA